MPPSSNISPSLSPVTSLWLDPDPLAQTTFSVCFLLQLPLCGPSLLQFIIYAAAE